MDDQAVMQCQHCRAQLVIVPSISIEPASLETLPARLDESFTILESSFSEKHVPTSGSGHTDRMEESFILLQDAHSHHEPSNTSAQQQQQQRFSIDERMQTLAKILELASEATSIDQPLCPDCTEEVQKELEAQIKELETELAGYLTLREKLEAADAAGELTPLDEKHFQKELKKAQEEVKMEETKLAKAEAELSLTTSQLSTATAISHKISLIENTYWHAFNAIMLLFQSTADFRESLQHKVSAAERAITTLKRTNVMADIFYIWKDGPFGTISGLRLGSISSTPAVEWWEINAAWGQAVLLLDTLAKTIDYTFAQYTLEPNGSYSRIIDVRGHASELYGPVSKIVCLSYDRAQVQYLACLKEFGEELALRGAMDEGKPFSLKYQVVGDRIGGVSIRYGLSRDTAWTRALKYMLLNLKFCLKGALGLMDRRTLMAVTALPREGPSF